MWHIKIKLFSHLLFIIELEIVPMALWSKQMDHGFKSSLGQGYVCLCYFVLCCHVHIEGL
jgi:hypothetical protein